MSAAYRSLYQRLLDALGTDSAQVSAIMNEIIIQQAQKPNKKETPEPGHGRPAKFSRILFRKKPVVKGTGKPGAKDTGKILERVLSTY